MLRQTHRLPGRHFALLLGVSTVSALALCNPAQAKDFDVKQYGATGDGTTDDSAAIAAAITAAEQTNVNSDNAVIFPAGKYFIGSASPVVAIKSIGLKGAVNATLAFGATGYISVTGNSPSVQNLTIANAGSTSKYAVLVSQSTGYSIQQNSFSGWRESIELNDAAAGAVSLNSFVTSNNKGVVAQNMVGDLTVSFNSFVGTSGAVFIDVVNDSHVVTVTENNFKTAQYAVRATGAGPGTLTCSNNTFSNCITATDAAIFRNYTFANNISTNCTVCSTDEGNNNVSITGNTINSPADDGIASSQDHGRLTISNNTISSPGNEGISVQLCFDVDITGNTINGSDGLATSNLVHTSNNSNNVSITKNTLRLANRGVYSRDDHNVTIDGNSIRHTQSAGIVAQSIVSNILIVNGNQVRNSGLSAGTGTDAAIYLKSAPKQTYKITNNTYVGNTTNLTYFINANGMGTPELHGNQTNTMLPDNPAQ